jgi:hypothetical protein
MNPPSAQVPLCRYLRTKQLYVSALAEGALQRHLQPDDASFYTCNLTLSALGCDDEAVHPRACGPCRKCFRAE